MNKADNKYVSVKSNFILSQGQGTVYCVKNKRAAFYPAPIFQSCLTEISHANLIFYIQSDDQHCWQNQSFSNYPDQASPIY